jgi:hypothetical protein
MRVGGDAETVMEGTGSDGDCCGGGGGGFLSGGLDKISPRFLGESLGSSGLFPGGEAFLWGVVTVVGGEDGESGVSGGVVGMHAGGDC